jgi:hypothetical protein
MAVVMEQVKQIADRASQRSSEDERFPTTVGLTTFESPTMYEDVLRAL